MDEIVSGPVRGDIRHDRDAPRASAAAGPVPGVLPAHGDTGAAEHGSPTIYDVARVAGVSIASVSRVLNGRRNPLPDTREGVERAAAHDFLVRFSLLVAQAGPSHELLLRERSRIVVVGGA